MRFFSIRNPILLEVTGQDAQRYLNARLTANIKSLPILSSRYAAALNPQGKTQGLFTVWALTAQRFFLVSDGGSLDPIVAGVKKYIVADRVNVTDFSGKFSLYHLLPDESSSSLKQFLNAPVLPEKEGELLVLTEYLYLTGKQRGCGIGIDLLISNDQVSKLNEYLASQRAYELSINDINFARLSYRIPSFPDELNENTLFSEAHFEKAYSLNKGCYAGQEVIEKVEAIGHSAKALQLIEFEGCPVISYGAIVAQDGSGTPLGKALTSAWNPQSNTTLCFASLKNDSTLGNQSVNIDGQRGTIRWQEH